MNENTASQIKILFSENEEFRKEFVTNTKSILEKYGIKVGDDMPIEFQETEKGVPIKTMKCVIVDAKETTNGFLICDF